MEFYLKVNDLPGNDLLDNDLRNCSISTLWRALKMANCAASHLQLRERKAIEKELNSVDHKERVR